MKETTIQNKIRLRFGSRDDMRLMRNNNGMLKDIKGQAVTYGLGKGTSDLIGWLSFVITPEMVGKKIAAFTAIECKLPDASTNSETYKQQERFIAVVKDAGGIATFACCESEVAVEVVEYIQSLKS